MDNILVILLVLAVVKFFGFGGLLLWMFRGDISEWRSGRGQETQVSPTCVYCESKWTAAVDEGQTRWDNDELVLSTTYECQHCHMPFWHVERVRVDKIKA